MALDLTILYRGPLSSCNYDCHYCPFAKHHETAAELRRDRQQLQRFTSWIAARTDDRISVLFTPWGEAMTRRWYRDAIARLSHLPNIRKVAIQTNLSWDTQWIRQCDLGRLGLWCSWHPEQVGRDRFVAKCHELDDNQVRYSVGIVGLKNYYEQALALRNELSPDVYMWVNAFKDVENYYSEEEVSRWSGIDPLFRVNNRHHPSLDRPCRTGESVISVDGHGTIRRCHFIKTPIGNLYEPGFEQSLQPRNCSNQTCSCHIGYIHMPALGLYRVFGAGLLERVPRAELLDLDTLERAREHGRLGD
jgi:MoaA/NifB/PqqE/SkfB family radical SAM enzyme